MSDTRYPDRRWVVFDTSETGSIDFSQVLQTSVNTLRLNISGSQTFVKWDRIAAVEEVLYADGDDDIPADKHAYGLAKDDPAVLTVDVEAFCS